MLDLIPDTKTTIITLPNEQPQTKVNLVAALDLCGRGRLTGNYAAAIIIPAAKQEHKQDRERELAQNCANRSDFSVGSNSIIAQKCIVIVVLQYEEQLIDRSIDLARRRLAKWVASKT